MSTDNLTLLRDTAIEILERFAFLLGDPAESPDDDALPLPEKLWVITLVFRGPRSGALRLATAPPIFTARNWMKSPTLRPATR
jgi:hypothetical protein